MKLTSSGFLPERERHDPAIPRSSSAFLMHDVFPIPDGPSTMMPRPGVFSATTTRSNSNGATNVCVGTPDFLNTSSSRGTLTLSEIGLAHPSLPRPAAAALPGSPAGKLSHDLGAIHSLSAIRPTRCAASEKNPRETPVRPDTAAIFAGPRCGVTPARAAGASGPASSCACRGGRCRHHLDRPTPLRRPLQVVSRLGCGRSSVAVLTTPTVALRITAARASARTASRAST